MFTTSKLGIFEQRKGSTELGGYWDKAIGQNKHFGAGPRSSKIKMLSYNDFAPLAM